MLHNDRRDDALGELARFRHELYGCLTARADALFELCDAVLCADGPVTSLVELSLAAEHRRGHGALYDGVNQGQVDVDRLRNVVVSQSIPRCFGGRIVLGIDVSNWLRPDAVTSPDRLFCHTYARGKGKAQMIPGWPYSFVAVLERGRTSWTAILDARRVGPDDEGTAVAAAQLRVVVEQLIAAGHWKDGDPRIWIVGDSGYDGPRLVFLLADLPVDLLVRLRSDRVLAFPPPPRGPATVGRTLRHGEDFTFSKPWSWPEPAHETTTETSRYGTAVARSWYRLHPRLTRRGEWAGHEGDLPIIEGTVIRLQVDRLPGDGAPTPLWLWFSGTGTDAEMVDQVWQMFLRRFDLEHTFRFLKQTLGWTKPRLRTPATADRWTWLLIAACTQLRLTRSVVEDLRRPWEKTPTTPDRLTPARVRRGFRNTRPATTLPASAPKPSRPGPGRPPGSRNTRKAPHHNPGKNTKTDTTAKDPKKQTG
ncbi:NF041680 family putative transposase [Amycolatopsis sp. H20-H5]|uniref:NF041680 family putative transposase n=1 Tax=Amycolatopsis sp. H20-H5 TaxID=3046309 RepID=UPI002DBB8E1B|nr:NF041680 family putative transposase [Amycolatopsis sp. H20-H5]MEC3974390.1 NF041680 family putative transposase [Amycolatopsis sp. H20-H5]